MKLKTIQITVFLLILALYGSLLVYKVRLPVGDDMAQHVRNGEAILQGNLSVLYFNYYSYTEPNHVFTNHSWLSEVIFALLHMLVGWGGLVVFKVIILVSSFALIFLTALKKANFWLVAFLSLPTILILIERTSLRPEVFSYLFMAIFLYILFDFEKNPNTKKIYWLVPIQLLWVNMHLFFIVGIGLVGGFLVEKVISNYKNFWLNPLVKKLALLLFSLVLISFINPHGVTGAFSPIQAVISSYKGEYGFQVSEEVSVLEHMRLFSPQDDIPIFIYIPAVILLGLSFLLNWRKKPFDSTQGKPIFLFLASVFMALGGFFAIRLINFFGLIFLLALSANLNGIFIRLTEGVNKRFNKQFNKIGESTKNKLKILMVLVFALGCVFVFWVNHTHVFKYYEFGIGLTEKANDAANFFKYNNLKGPIFNDYDIGSYLIYHLFPQERVFVDNRYDAYPASFFDYVYEGAINDESVWQKVNKKYNFNSIFFYQYDGSLNVRSFFYYRLRDPEWSLVYIDKYAIIFVKNVLENKNIIDKFAITKNNVEQKLDHLLKSPDFDDQVVAADTFYLFDMQDLGSKTLLQVVSKWPKRGKIWMVLGQTELNKNEPESLNLAIEYLEKSISLGQKTAEAYSFLGLAYSRSGKFDEAKSALKKALKIDPNRRDAMYILSQIR